jgi:hypothetical protein
MRDRELKKNCWEFKSDLQESGKESKEGCSQCPVPQLTNYDGINGGKNGGRVCWLITGTLCSEDVQLTYSHKLGTCRKCDFYLTVEKEEGSKLCLPIDVVEYIVNEKRRTRGGGVQQGQ